MSFSIMTESASEIQLIDRCEFQIDWLESKFLPEPTYVRLRGISRASHCHAHLSQP